MSYTYVDDLTTIMDILKYDYGDANILTEYGRAQIFIFNGNIYFMN